VNKQTRQVAQNETSLPIQYVYRVERHDFLRDPGRSRDGEAEHVVAANWKEAMAKAAVIFDASPNQMGGWSVLRMGVVAA
jgi:hypothetical protein